MFSREILRLDPGDTCHSMVGADEAQVLGALKRRSVVVGLSGGVDSSVVAALSVRALGKQALAD